MMHDVPSPSSSLTGRTLTSSISSSEEDDPSTSRLISDIDDGHLDPQINLSHLSKDQQWQFKLRFDLRFLQHPQRAYVKLVNAWKKDGMVSVAQKACEYCIKIKSARPSGAGDPPFSCLVRSRPSLKDVRPDGSQICACCSGLARTSCKAWGGALPSQSSTPEKPGQGSQIRSGQERFISDVDFLDGGSDLSSIEEDDIRDQAITTDSDSDVPLAMKDAKRRLQDTSDTVQMEVDVDDYGSIRHTSETLVTSLSPTESALDSSRSDEFDLEDDDGNVRTSTYEIVRRALVHLKQSW